MSVYACCRLYNNFSLKPNTSKDFLIFGETFLIFQADFGIASRTVLTGVSRAFM